jgi:hypothetical protein
MTSYPWPSTLVITSLASTPEQSSMSKSEVKLSVKEKVEERIAKQSAMEILAF